MKLGSSYRTSNYDWDILILQDITTQFFDRTFQNILYYYEMEYLPQKNLIIPQSTKVAKLADILRDKNNLLIVMQDNPDPDAIASAVALGRLAKHLAHLSCSIVHGGTIGRAENRSLVRYLQLHLYYFDQINLKDFDVIAMVDTQPGTGNNAFPPNMVPDIVIDHHPSQPFTQIVRFVDVRCEYGAAATILYEYLCQADIIPDIPLATALLYAIRTDTCDLGPEATRADMEAFELLYPLADKRILSEIQWGRLPREYFQMMADALRNAKIYQECIVTGLGEILNPDMIGEMADFLLREDEITYVMCYGVFRKNMLISIRTTTNNKNAEELIRQIVDTVGTGGGHRKRAGGQIPLKNNTKGEYLEKVKIIREKLLSILGDNLLSEKSLIQS